MSNIHVNGKLEVGDLFNETDSETDQKVVEIRRHNDPPVVLCRSLKPAEESSETEQEYDLKYVLGHVINSSRTDTTIVMCTTFIT